MTSTPTSDPVPESDGHPAVILPPGPTPALSNDRFSVYVHVTPSRKVAVTLWTGVGGKAAQALLRHEEAVVLASALVQAAGQA